MDKYFPLSPTQPCLHPTSAMIEINVLGKSKQNLDRATKALNSMHDQVLAPVGVAGF